MGDDLKIGLEEALTLLRAAGEPTRLRLLALLSRGDLTVKDLTTILGQSQPRISRHLKLLCEAGLIERHPEGAWAYYRIGGGADGHAAMRALLALLDPEDAVVDRDRERADEVKQAHAEAAARYFAENAGQWDHIRSLHVAEAKIEEAMREALGPTPFQSLLDLGTGTGRLLEIFSDLYVRGLGIDTSADMLAVARANLNRAGVDHARVQQGDIFSLNLTPGSFDVVTLHQVLHFLDDPARAIAEAARMLTPGGRLLVVDFAPHDMEFLRSDHAHRRLGFSAGQVGAWFGAVGLEPVLNRDFPPPGNGDQPQLTVGLWLARDPRRRIA
ncbi:MAG: metalloregulator ArsR/SmtB family transcription factor [Hyphomicrobiales bacterium]|nr:metalloregulator ArsR/SmtB family transcription factor [Hyphomicrobiales bacterium]